MAGYEILEPSAGSTDWVSFITQTQYQRYGFMGLSFTDWADSTEAPKIGAGGKIEVSGSLFYFASTEAITGSPSSSNPNYIMVVTSSSSITAQYTTADPTWSNMKNGWYDATGNKRYIGRLDYDGTDYTNKTIYMTRAIKKFNIASDAVNASQINGLTGSGAVDLDNIPDGTYQKVHGDYVDANGYIDTIEEQGSNAKLRCKVIEIGDWDMDSDGEKIIAHGLASTTIRHIEILIRRDSTSTSVYNLVHTPVAGNAGYFIFNSSDLHLYRLDSATFDSSNFGDTDYNRGWVTIWYEA